MGSRRSWLISAAVLAAVAVGMGLYLRTNRELLDSLLHVSFVYVAWLVVLGTLFLATNGMFLRAFAAKLGVRLSWTEWFGLAAVTAMANYMTPFSGGMIARAVYLNRVRDLPYAQFAVLLGSNYLVSFWVIGVVGLATLTLWGGIWSYWQVALLLLLVVAATSILALVPHPRIPGKSRIGRAVNGAVEGWSQVRRDRRLLAKLFIYTLSNILLNGWSYWSAYHALGFEVPFVRALLISLVALFSIIVNVTPGNLGIQEAWVGLCSQLLQVGAGEGLLASILVRASMLIPVFTLGPLFSFVLARRMSDHHCVEGAQHSREGGLPR